ncbi:MAG: AMP-binding protein [Actinomycetota bacterium]
MALAAADPDRPAVTCGDETLSRAGLVAAADQLALDLRARGLREGDMLTIALPNSVGWFVAFAAAWRLGATPQPVSSRLPQRELEAIIELADPPVVLGLPEGTVPGRVCLPAGYQPPRRNGELPDVISRAWKAPTSGGSTGRPKLIVSASPAQLDTADPVPLSFVPGGTMVMPGPLYHNGPLIWAWIALMYGHHNVVLPRFDPEATLAAIQQHRATVIYLVPTMMKRIWRLPEPVRDSYDLSSLQTVWHLAEPCPPWLKHAWIKWLGADRIFELYGATEAQTATIITGGEWLAHRGSVGKPGPGTLRILDPDGEEAGPGQMGEVWLRHDPAAPTYRYVGAVPRQRDGWESVGDTGYLDADGYLYLGDRASDMILVGGANVYPAEVEAALLEHPAVESCAVIGLPDEDKGNAVYAIVQADQGAAPEAELRPFLADRLASYKLPVTYEYVGQPLRDDAGKVRRSELRAARLPAGS